MRKSTLSVQNRQKEEPHCAHGGVYSADRDLVRLDFSSSVNPLGPPKAAIDAIKDNLRELASEYPDPECKELRRSLCEYLGDGIYEAQLCIGNGALEIIHWFAQTFAEKRAVVTSPTFCEYELASRRAGSTVERVPFDKRPDSDDPFELDADKVIAVSRRAGALYLCNPNNPTGLTIPAKDIERIVTELSGCAMVFLDECFIELTDRPLDSFAGRTDEFANLVVLRSLTKSFALAGLRLGYSISSEKNATRLAAKRVHWNVNGLAQAAGTASLRSAKNYLAAARALVSRERGYMKKMLERSNQVTRSSFSPQVSNANFFLVRLSQRFAGSAQFRDELLKRTGILVRDCSTFYGMDSCHVRVAVKTHAQNQELLGGFKKMEEFVERG